MRHSSTLCIGAKLKFTTASLSVLIYILLGSPADAAPDQRTVQAALVEIRGVNRINREYPIATGFVVSNNGHVVTVGQQAIQNARRIVVSPFLGSGASFEVTQTEYHPSLEVTLLHVPALRAQPLSFEDASERGQPVLVPLKEEEAFRWGQGSIENFIRRPVQAYPGSEQRFIRHSADLYSPVTYGAPLLSDQGGVLGVNHRNPDLPLDALTRNNRPEGSSFAVPSSDLAEFLQSRGVLFQQVASSTRNTPQPSYQVTAPSPAADPTDANSQNTASATVSPPPSDLLQGQLNEAQSRLIRERDIRLEAQRQAIEARERAEEMERLAEEALSRSTASEQERETARLDAESAQAAAEAAEDLAEDAAERASEAEEGIRLLQEQIAELQSERIQATEDATSARRNLYIAGSVAALSFALLAVGFLAYARRSSSRVKQARARLGEAEFDARRARSDAERAKMSAPFDCLMEGRSPERRRYTLKIPARLLGAPEGVVIGRNPKHAAMVVDHKGISRQHARLTVVDETLHIEDLNSTNGLFVNDLRLAPGQPTRLRVGETVRLGPIRFKLSLAWL